MRARLVLCGLSILNSARGSVTVYNQIPLGDSTGTAAAAQYTGSAAYNPLVLNPPPIPNPAPPTAFNVQLLNSNTTQAGLSIPIPSSFFGFSIEMSVVNQVLGYNSTFLQVPFLNLMANIAQRSGSVHIRVGGNTQERAELVDTLPNGRILMKDKTNVTNPTATPALMYTADLIYMLGNISSLVDVKWYLGIPMNDTSNLRLQIAEIGSAVLGDHLLGFQVGNEPDLYGRHGSRPATYSPTDYYNEFGIVMAAINNDPAIPVKNTIIGPSIAMSAWTPQQIWDTGYIQTYTNNLGFVSVEYYPDNNCFAIWGGAGAPVDYQTEFPKYLDHTAGQKILAQFLPTSAVALANGKPLLMFETNTASCGGFPGISDTYGSALWGLDYGLQMAYSNFSGALLHVGGQSVYYNPFTAPPTNQSAFHQWTIGPIYFSTLIIAEALGNTNTAQILDLNANGGNVYTPAYAIYEQGAVARVALFNYITDPSGANTYTASISIGGGQTGQPDGTPTSVRVKYLAAASVSSKDNITWAGQSFGSNFESDGRLKGDLDIKTVECANGVCQIQVPAPGFALVFLTDNAFAESNPPSTQTFPTTAHSKVRNTATVDPSVLATSNGSNGGNRKTMGSTSQESSAASPSMVPSTTMTMLTIVAGVILAGRYTMW